jgi:hypothetical protein
MPANHPTFESVPFDRARVWCGDSACWVVDPAEEPIHWSCCADRIYSSVGGTAGLNRVQPCNLLWGRLEG